MNTFSWNEMGWRTVHQLLILHIVRETGSIPFEVHHEDMEPHTTIVTLHRDRARLVLKRKVVPYRP
jgi:hypothetical protein